MQDDRRFIKVRNYQSMGFMAILVLCWADLLFNYPALILGDLPGLPPQLWACLLQTLLILTVWLLVALSTHRLWQRLTDLEGFLRVCSWCRRIEYKGAWMRFERFLDQSFDTPTTHGICEECLHEQLRVVHCSKHEDCPKSAVES